MSWAIKSIYTQNGKEFKQNTNTLLLFNFDQECKDFSESDGIKLKLLSNMIFTSLMFYGVGLDLGYNDFSVTNSALLSGLLLSLSLMLLFVTAPFLNAASEYTLKKTAINSIEEQFKGGDPLVEQPNSTINSDSVHAHGREQVV